jgi:hypothetical protein
LILNYFKSHAKLQVTQLIEVIFLPGANDIAQLFPFPAGYTKFRPISFSETFEENFGGDVRPHYFCRPLTENGALVKGLRHLPFTEESRVRFPYALQALKAR